MSQGACDRAAELSKRQNARFRPRSDVVGRLEDLFGDDVATMRMTEVGDALHAASCHNMTLPCSAKVSNRELGSSGRDLRTTVLSTVSITFRLGFKV